MKLICINTDSTKPGLLTIGNEYEITERWKGCYEVNDCYVSLSNFETPIDVLKRLIKTAGKMIIDNPRQGLTVEILITDNYLVCYSHTKGSHWNIAGNHYRYYHDLKTGEFTPEYKADKNEPTRIKKRLLKADFKSIMSVREIK